MLAAAATAALTFPNGARAADGPSDSFIAGYAAAVLERELSVKADGLSVVDGHLTLRTTQLSPQDRTQALKVLASVPGVKEVTINDEPPASAAKPLTALRVPDANAGSTTTPASAATATSDAAPDAGETRITTEPEPLTLFLGAGRTFMPLLADLRWPHFFASYNHYERDTGTTDLGNVASVGFGETISLLKQSYTGGFRWEFGVQAGLFAFFDMESESKDLVNADYMVGPYFAARQGNFSLLARVYHQSTHLGDEYLLRSDADPRVNYSFETINLLLSYDLPYGFRIYGGGGYLFDIDPPDLEPWTIQYGFEWISPQTVFGTSWIRPVVAFDAQNRENNDYAFTYSVRAGVQLEDPARFSQRLQIMLEYFDGNNPNGQFYDNHVRYYGFGAHFYF